MTTKARKRAHAIIGLVVMICIGAAGGLVVAWLKSAYGVSPYWFVGIATGLGVPGTGFAGWVLTRRREPVFVLDLIVSFEGFLALTLLSAGGLVALVSLVLSGVILILVAVTLMCIALATITYVFKHTPPTTWDDDPAH